MGHEPIEIHLNRKEVLSAIEAGTHSHVEEIAERFRQTRLGLVTSWDVPINEAFARTAVVKWLNGRQDVQARSAIKDYGNLVISDLDRPGAIMVLVTCAPPVMRIEGYIRVSEAWEMKECERETLAGRRWFISKKLLKDPRELGNG